MMLIGLHGQKRSGKSTVARYLVEQYGFAEVSFAAPLYRGLATMLGIDLGDLQDEAKKEAPIEWLNADEMRMRVFGTIEHLPTITPRYLLQTLGTEWGRGLVREDIWLRVGARAIERHAALGHPGIVVSDVRFDNEARLILERGGELWGVSRIQRAGARDAHASEAGISTNFPSKGIVNHASFPSLYARVDELVDQRVERMEGAA